MSREIEVCVVIDDEVAVWEHVHFGGLADMDLSTVGPWIAEAIHVYDGHLFEPWHIRIHACEEYKCRMDKPWCGASEVNLGSRDQG